MTADNSPSEKPIGDDRSIKIARDAIENTIISGDGNLVIIQASRERTVVEERPVETEIGPNPYMGVSAFHEEQADRFFGRDKQIEELWDSFRDLNEPTPGEDPPIRLLPIYGPSGSGKSSVARAGLIPELARRPMPGFKQARIGVLTPGAHPLNALAAVLARIATNDPTPVAKAREFQQELETPNEKGQFDGLRRIAEVLPEIASSPLIVLVDQFEEIYSLCETDPDRTVQERDVFINNLIAAASDVSRRVSVIITLRSDFLGETQGHTALNSTIASQGYLVPAMKEEQLRTAIAQPAIDGGRPIDEATVDLLVAETRGRAGALPLLQFALTRIWQGLSDGAEPAETLKRIGGVGGALAGEAQRIYDRLNPEDQATARRAFLELVQLGEGTRDTRRRVQVDGLFSSGTDQQRVEKVIQAFSRPSARLVTLSGSDEGTDFAEVTHESLIDNWTELRGWLEDNRDDIRFQRTVDEATKSWDQQGRPDGSLWRPPNLSLLETFHAETQSDESPLKLTPLQNEFYLASRGAEQARKKKRRAPN